MSGDTDRGVLVDALTRANVRRDRAGVIGSDEELLRRLARQLQPAELPMLAAIGQMLRLIDGLLRDLETGEGFVGKFDEQWRAIRGRYEEKLHDLIEKVDDLYEVSQLFCASENHRDEEPCLLNVQELKALAEPVYMEVKQWWCKQVGVTSSKSG